MRVAPVKYAAAVLGMLLLSSPATAQSRDWVEVMRQVSETGKEIVFSSGFAVTYAQCNRWVKGQTVPRVVPRGTSISPGGVSYEWTVTEVWCERKSRYEWRRKNNG